MAGQYTVESLTSAGVPTDISDFVHSLDTTKFYSDGRISTSALTLQAGFGQFMTDSRGGSTPILKQYDLIRLTYADDDGSVQQHIFEIINDLAQFNKSGSHLLPLTLEGRERNFALIPFSGFFDPAIGHLEMSKAILSVYGFSKNSTTQPTLLDTINELPAFNPNFWDFQYIDNCLDALKEVVRVANLSVAAGGAGDRFGISYEDVFGDITIMRINIVSQGSINSGAPFITITGDPLFNPIQEINKVKQPFTGSVTIARGRPGSGGTPRQGDIYRSKLEFYESTPAYNNSTPYKLGAFVSFGSQLTDPEIPIGQVYQADVNTTGNLPTDALFWSPVSAAVFIGPTLQYSPFTIDKATLYRNECVNPEASFASDVESSPKMLDCNIVINDVETQRDLVYFRSNTDLVGSLSAGQLKYLFEGTDYYNGFRILVDVSNFGTGTGAFSPTLDAFSTGAGNDPNGLPYANNSATFLDGNWFVIKEHQDFDQILSRFDGLYEWNVNFVAKSRFPASDLSNTNRRRRQAGGGTPDRWKALGEQFLANDCLHSPSSITNIDGLVNPINNGTGFYSDDSAVRIIYEYGTISETPDERTLLDQIAGIIPAAVGFLGAFAINAVQVLYDLFLTPQYRNAGWWITFTAPWPFNTSNGITEEVGELYGGQTLLELNNHPYFDTYNQRVAYSGKAGFNEVDSEDLMEITGVTFLYRLDIQVNGSTIPFTGDIPCSYWALDDNGTLWKSKKVYPFLNDVYRFTFDFGDFTPVYRARSPFAISNIVTNILLPTLEIRERLFPARIKMQGFMLELAYDEHGRYLPNLLENVIKPTVASLFTGGAGVNVKFIGDYDSFQWVKTPIAIENGTSLGITTDRTIFPEIKDYPNITNLEQLTRAAIADFSVEFFQYEEWEITQSDKADLTLLETVFLREEDMIIDNDQLLASVNAYSTGINYVPNDVVDSGGVIFTCIAPAFGAGQAPPDSNFWNTESGAFVPNTRELFVSELAFTVTNQRDFNRTSTLTRRIPKVTA